MVAGWSKKSDKTPGRMKTVNGKTIFVLKRETWDRAKCLKMCKYAPANAYGDKPPRGLIGRIYNHYVSMGSDYIYNGGTDFNGRWCNGVHYPIPKLAKGFKIENYASWGLRITEV